MRKPEGGAESEFAPWVKYNPLTDTLLIYFYGKPEPAINIDIENSTLYLMVDPETDALLGVHIQAFVSPYLPEHPHFRQLEAVQRLLANDAGEPDFTGQDSTLPKSLVEMVIGSLVLEHGLWAA